MTKITEELAATARWIADPGTSRRCKNNNNSVLFTYTENGNMVIAGMVGKGDVEVLTKHIIKTLMNPLDQESKEEYLLQTVANVLMMLSEIKNQEDDE